MIIAYILGWGFFLFGAKYSAAFTSEGHDKRTCYLISAIFFATVLIIGDMK